MKFYDLMEAELVHISKYGLGFFSLICSMYVL